MLSVSDELRPHRIAPRYTTQLQAGLGLVQETKALLEIWELGLSTTQLYQTALGSGRFPHVAASRLRNVVVECFAPRYLVAGGAPACALKCLVPALSNMELNQLFLLHTCRANPILRDFVRQVYWDRYVSGHSHVATEDARRFVERSVDDQRTSKRWAESTVRRVSAYLTGCCADYGLLESGTRTSRRILPFRIAPSVVAYLAHELHFAGLGDNAVIAHEDWNLFGIDRAEVLEEFKRLSLKGIFIIQAAGDVVRVGWKFQDMKALCDVIAQS